jgi:phospho-N-acetylmuramoyl-pentapeptide-transferase
MLYNLLSPLAEQYTFFNIFKYLTFRSGAAVVTAFALSLFLTPILIKYLGNNFSEGQPIRRLGPQTHMNKQGTPTMGGLVILTSMFTSTIMWSDINNTFIWVILFVTLSFGILGFIDDYVKVKKRDTGGVRGKMKLFIQAAVSILACILIQDLSPTEYSYHLFFPFFKELSLDLGIFYIAFVLIVIVGSSNAVNLTDGLDGLAIVPIGLAAACFALIAYLTGNSVFAHYLQITHIPNAGEVAVLCSSMVGASLGFLWFNSSPAEIFMGDTGSLSLGGAIGTISVIVKHEIVLAIIGGLFVIEALSVIIQVYYFKLSGGKRFFKMAPLHHHFEKSGLSETKVVARFWIIAVIFAILGLSTLKLR